MQIIHREVNHKNDSKFNDKNIYNNINFKKQQHLRIINGEQNEQNIKTTRFYCLVKRNTAYSMN